jgi:hypothetical protein
MWHNLEVLKLPLFARQFVKYCTTVKLCTNSPTLVRAVRSLIISAATAVVIPSIERIGVASTNIIAAVLALVAQG